MEAEYTTKSTKCPPWEKRTLGRYWIFNVMCQESYPIGNGIRYPYDSWLGYTSFKQPSLLQLIKSGSILRYVGVIWFLFSCSLTSTGYLYTTILMLQWQIYDETYAKTGLKIGPPQLQLWLSEVHDC
jgi:hypothetical protein